MKTINQIYSCQIPSLVSGMWDLRCHLRIFQVHPEVQTVIISDMVFEIGWFIPYIVEKLADQILQEFKLDPSKLVWLESYSPDRRNPTDADFSQVTFEWQDGKARHPQWHEIIPELAPAFISEALLYNRYQVGSSSQNEERRLVSESSRS